MDDLFANTTADEDQVLDEATEDETVAKVEYDITSYGADYDVEGLVKRLERESITIPPFQRDYVWTQQEASRFIESLLLGLPVPGIFLAREPQTEQLLVIDGQQRLKSLQFFYKGVFNPNEAGKDSKVFQLKKVQPHLENRTYDGLENKYQERLNNSILHATIIKQDKPSDDNTSIYHIFERLNTGGRKLAPQQIRDVIYHGPFIKLLSYLNNYQKWRAIFGKKSKLLKDQELILRFLALHFNSGNYQSPMKEFLNLFASSNKEGKMAPLSICEFLFKKTIDVVYEAAGNRAFRLERVVNAAVFDSIMVGVSRQVADGKDLNNDLVRLQYDNLLKNPTYVQAVTQATANENAVKERLRLAIDAFSSA